VRSEEELNLLSQEWAAHAYARARGLLSSSNAMWAAGVWRENQSEQRQMDVKRFGWMRIGRSRRHVGWAHWGVILKTKWSWQKTG
jgi:hypothetical protein